MKKENANKQQYNEVTTGEPLERGGYFVGYNLVMRNAMKVFNLNNGQFACLTMLFSYAGADKDRCFPSQPALAEDLNTTDRTVRRYLEELEAKGVITTYNRQNSKNFKVTNVYDLSPCLNKIRELFCKDEEQSSEEFGITLTKKVRNEGQDKTVLSENTGSESSEHSEESSEFGESHNVGQDNIVLSESMHRTEMSAQTGQNCPLTNNTIHITPFIKDKDIDDDKRSCTSPALSDEELNVIISELREATKDELTDRSFKAVIRKVVDKYKQGGIGSFRDYLVTSLVNKIEALELRRIKEEAKSAIKENRMVDRKQREKELNDYQPTGKFIFYNWLEQ